MPWIDVLKGAGIVSVVAGHIFSSYLQSAIYMFHMPLFFLISGYLFKPSGWSRINSTLRGIIVPSAATVAAIILVFWAIPSLIIGRDLDVEEFKKFYGTGVLVVLWFPVTLSVILALYELLYLSKNRSIMYCIMVFSLILSYVNEGFSYFNPPLSLGAVPHAFVIFAAGSIASKIDLSMKPSTAFFLIFSLALACLFPNLKYDMYKGDYGVPIVSLIYSSIVCFALAIIAKTFTLVKKLSPLKNLGSCSLLVMFIHQPIQIYLRFYHVENSLERFILTIAACIAIITVVKNNVLLRTLFLGTRAVRAKSS